MGRIQGVSAALGELRYPIQGNVLAPAAPEVVLGKVREDSKKPGSHPLRISARRKLPVPGDQGTLHQVRGLVSFFHHPEGVPIQDVPVPANQEAIGIPVSGQHVPDHLGVCALGRTDHA